MGVFRFSTVFVLGLILAAYHTQVYAGNLTAAPWAGGGEYPSSDGEGDDYSARELSMQAAIEEQRREKQYAGKWVGVRTFECTVQRDTQYYVRPFVGSGSEDRSGLDTGIRLGLRQVEHNFHKDPNGYRHEVEANVGWKKVIPDHDPDLGRQDDRESVFVEVDGLFIEAFRSKFNRVLKNMYVALDTHAISEFYTDGGGVDRSRGELGVTADCELGVLFSEEDGGFVSIGVCLQARTGTYAPLNQGEEYDKYELLRDNFDIAPGIVLRNNGPSDDDVYFEFKIRRLLDADETTVTAKWGYEDFIGPLDCHFLLTNDNLEYGFESAEPYENYRSLVGVEYSF